MPKCFAAVRTVALFSIMNTARSQARCSIFVYKCTTPLASVVNVYERGRGDMKTHHAVQRGALLIKLRM